MRGSAGREGRWVATPTGPRFECVPHTCNPLLRACIERGSGQLEELL
jgi:hypothetical protein